MRALSLMYLQYLSYKRHVPSKNTPYKEPRMWSAEGALYRWTMQEMYQS
jgi:hypothetical protein